jgi:hypothetical protein
MVIVFPSNKGPLARPAVTKTAEQRSRSFAYALTLSLALSLVLWAGVAAALVRL